jgi:transposase
MRKMLGMDRSSLEVVLAQGLSLAEIGRRFGRHEATIAYWVQKYGLEAVNHGKHAARGGLPRNELEELVERGKTIAEIAEVVDRSKPTVRHWLMRYGLKTKRKRGRRPAEQSRAAKEAGLLGVRMQCPRHGETDFHLDARGSYRCKRCRSGAVARRRRKVKSILVEEAGGCCCVCGYDRNMRALHFHHLDPALKRHEINAKGVAVALEKLRAEARKCVLLCSNCHAEVEDGLATVPASMLARASPG